MSSEDVRDSNGEVEGLADGMNRLTTESAPKTEEEYQQAQLTLRAIVSSREAGVIIGKGGQNVADLRDATGVKAGVSKVVPGVHDRVFSVTGSLEQISKAYGKVAQSLLEGAPSMGMGGIVTANGTHRKLTMCF
jgi:heterogeneous nuclear rnp K-like protein 2